jgi:hypothetical protein
MAARAATTQERIGRVGQRRQVVIPHVVDSQDVLTPAEAKEVRHGMKQIKEGRFKLWRDVKHELGRSDC